MQQMEYGYSTEFHFKEGSTIGTQAIVSFQAIVKREKQLFYFACMSVWLVCMAVHYHMHVVLKDARRLHWIF